MILTTCTNCGDSQVTWSHTMRLNSKGLLKHWLINVNTGQDHKCLSWSKQGGRDAIIPQTGYAPGEVERIKKGSAETHERHLAALEAMFRGPWQDNGELKPEYEIRQEDGMIHRRLDYVAPPKPATQTKPDKKYW